MSGTALDEEGQLNLLYVFVSSLFLMFAWTLWHGWESSVSGWGVAMTRSVGSLTPDRYPCHIALLQMRLGDRNRRRLPR